MYGTLNPDETKEFSIMVYVLDNKEKNMVEEIEEKLEKIEKLDIKKEFQNTKKYWRN